MALGWKNITVARTDCGADVFGLAGFLRDDDLICHDGPLGDVFNAVPLLEHIMNERDMQVKLSGASLGRFGYAPKGMMKGYVVNPIRLPTGELTGYIGITEAKLPKEFHLSNVVTFPKKTA